MKEAKTADVVKFEKAGDSVEGIFSGIEESRQFPESFCVKFASKDGILKAVFVSAIVKDLIDNNSIEKGDTIRIEYLGKKKTQDGKKEYNDYKVFFEKA